MAQNVDRNETDFIASLFDVPREVGNASLTSFLELIVARCSEWFGASSVSLFLTRDRADVMVLAATGGPSVSIPTEAEIRVGEGIAGVAALDGEPVLIDRLSDHPKFKIFVSRARPSLESSMVVPLWSNAGPMGVLNLSRARGQAKFSNANLRLAKSIASHLALAIENARLVAGMRDALKSIEAERAKFRGIFEGLGLAAYLLNRDGIVLESNSKGKELNSGWIDFAALISAHEAGQSEWNDPASGRSWSSVLNPIPGGYTLTLEETTDRDRQRRELDRLNRLAEIGQLTAAIAHEIRNPLTGIRSAAQMIRQAPEAADEFAYIIEEEAVKLSELCSQFLLFAKPIAPSHQRTPIGEVVQRVVRLLEGAFAQKKVKLNLEISPQLPMIQGDPLHWEQVLLNLMLNALEATEPETEVTLGVAEDRVWISDQGCGMSPDQVARLFTPFFTTKPHGTGLGLSNVKKIADANGAQITVRSEPGAGTRFDVHFGLRRAA